MGSFFRNVDSRGTDDSCDIPVGDSKGKIRSLKARVCCNARDNSLQFTMNL